MQKWMMRPMEKNVHMIVATVLLPRSFSSCARGARKSQCRASACRACVSRVSCAGHVGVCGVCAYVVEEVELVDDGQGVGEEKDGVEGHRKVVQPHGRVALGLDELLVLPPIEPETFHIPHSTYHRM